jgi:hypothetical protein
MNCKLFYSLIVTLHSSLCTLRPALYDWRHPSPFGLHIVAFSFLDGTLIA